MISKEFKPFFLGAFIGIIIGLIIFWIFWYLFNFDKEVVSESLIDCIANRSVLYTQLGCPACEEQEKVFGNHISKMKIIDCFYNISLCSNIRSTPTWMINNSYIEGIYNIEELKGLTGCQ